MKVVCKRRDNDVTVNDIWAITDMRHGLLQMRVDFSGFAFQGEPGDPGEKVC